MTLSSHFFLGIIQMIDVGENIIVPDDFTEKEMKTGIWRINLMAGGMAGAVSRSCTAPLDRIKVMLQVNCHTVKDMLQIN